MLEDDKAKLAEIEGMPPVDVMGGITKIFTLEEFNDLLRIAKQNLRYREVVEDWIDDADFDVITEFTSGYMQARDELEDRLKEITE